MDMGILAYFSIAFFATGILLVVLDIVKERFYPYLIFASGLLLLYATTLQGAGIVGTDASVEFLVSQLAKDQGWNLLMNFSSSNTSLLIGWIMPQLSNLTHIELTWLYKTIPPLIFAFAPVLLYLVFRKQIGDKRAFYATAFFISVPTFFTEIATINKSMVAETLMALVIWIIFSSWRGQIKAVSILFLTGLTMWVHYTIGFILIAYMLCMMIFILLSKINWLQLKQSIPFYTIAITVVISLVLGYLYFSYASEGRVVYNITSAIKAKVSHISTGNLVESNNSVINMGLGLDFTRASFYGKAFRILQYFTQLLIVTGSIWLLLKYRKCYNFRAEFIGGVFGACCILALCIIIPTFANVLNSARWYHLSLFFLAPMFILGCDAITNSVQQRR